MTLRIELESLGVRVVTAMVGEVATQIFQNGDPPALPKDSYYQSVKQYVYDQAAGKMQKNDEPAEVTARNLVGDVMAGRSGQVWRGGLAGTVRLASWLLPTRLLVSDDASSWFISRLEMLTCFDRRECSILVEGFTR